MAFDRLPREEALKAYPELLPAYQRLDRLSKSLSHVDAAKRQVGETVARTAVSHALHDGVIVGSRAASRTQEAQRGVER